MKKRERKGSIVNALDFLIIGGKGGCDARSRQKSDDDIRSKREAATSSFSPTVKIQSQSSAKGGETMDQKRKIINSI